MQVKVAPRDILKMSGLAAVYFLAAKWGLTLAFVQANATAVWPPTGLSLAVLLIAGRRLWPGVFFGAFLANLFTNGTVWTSLAIAVGNSLEALCGAYWVDRWAGGRNALETSQNLFRFAAFGGVLAPMVSATVGVGTLFLSGFGGSNPFEDVWATWWLGDMAGALLVAPPFLLARNFRKPRMEPLGLAEAAAVAAFFIVTAWVVFGGTGPVSTQHYPVQFVFMPILLWIAVRFSPFSTSLVVLVLSFLSLEATRQGLGPFHGATENQSLLFLQSFMSVISVTLMALACAVQERRRVEEELRWSHADLQVKVLQRTEDLTMTNLRLQKEIDEKGALARELTASNEKFQLLSEATREGVVLLDHGVILGANSAFCRMFGWGLDEVLGRPAEDFVARESRAVVRQHIRSHDEGTYAAKGLRKDGSSLDIEVTGRTVQRDGGTARVTAIQDVTELNRREEQIRRLALLVETSTDFICQTSIDGHMTYLNGAGRDLVGLWRDEDISVRLHEDFIAPKDVPRLRNEVIAALLQKGSWAGEFDLKHFRTGEVLPMHFTAVLIRDPVTGEPRALAGIGRDMRESKRKELEIQRMALIVENSPDLILLSVPGGETVFLNRGGRRMLGIGDDEDLKTLEPERFIHPGDLEKARQTIAPALKLDGHWEGELRLRNGKTQETLHLLFTSVVIHDPRTGLPSLTASIGRDITERHKIEELARSNKELEQFAYVASHDLQEPLRMIASFVQLLARSHKGRLDAEADEYIEHTVDGVVRMQTLIKDLLAYSRLGNTQPFTKVDCKEALKQALQNLEPALKEQKAEVRFNGLPEVTGDFNQMVQLFQNLIGNAVKFKSEKKPEVTVGAQEKDGEWLFSVRDNGIGIEPQYAQQIFEVFKRLHTRQEYPGTGIGLAICKKVVNRHGGRIWVESQLGEGACFYWTLPKRKGGAP